MKKYFLILIIILAFVLRFWKLSSYPAFNADEAAIGYNVYSLLLTGKDEHGNSWPVHFQSFNDFKPGGYFYLVLPFVKLFGLNELSVRFPGALLGVLSVLVLYFLVKKLFSNERTALISALFLAISPWHIHFSRGGWEVNAATTFILMGVYLFVLFQERKKWISLLQSLFFFGLSMYTYHSARLIAPLLGLGLLIIYWKNLDFLKYMKRYLLSLFFLIVVLAPLGIDLMRPEAASRMAGVGLFADPGPLSRIEEQRSEHSDFKSFFAKAMHNKLINYGLAFLENWSEHYHGLFLFLSGDDIERNKVPETGQMYLYDLPLILIGLWIILKNIKKKKNDSSGYKIILYWLIIAPVAAALTFQSPHALRAQNMVIPLVIISSLGLNLIIDNIKFLGKLFVAIIIIWQFARYLHMYWIHMAKEYVFSSQYGVKELVGYVKEKESNYNKIIVTDRYDQPYILFLFYLKYDPAKFQSSHQLTPRDGYGFSTVNHFDKYYFTAIRFDETRPNNPKSLIIGTPEEIPDEANIIKKIYGSNDYEYFDAVAN